MGLASWLKLQVIYAVVAISFNLVSYWRIKLDLEGLSNTNPLLGIAVISPLLFAVWAAHRGYRKVFIAINSISAPLFFYAGIIKHFSSISSLSWASIVTSPVVLAVVLNCFGVSVMIMGIITIRKTNQTGRSQR